MPSGPKRSLTLPQTAPRLSVPDQRHVVFRNPWHVREHAVALLDTQVLEDVRELARAVCQLPERHLRELAVSVDLIERDLLTVSSVPVRNLVCDVDLPGASQSASA